MNFDLSDDAKMLGEQARRFLSERAGPVRARRAMNGEDMGPLTAEIAGLGWPAVRVPEARGGLGLGFEELAALAEEAGRALLPAPLLSTFGLVEALRLADDDAGAAWLPRLASGEATGCLAWAEGSRGPAAMPAAKVDNGVLSGVKSPVADGLGAGVAVVTVAGPDGPELALAALDGPAVARVAVETLDLVRPSATLTFAAAPATRICDNATWHRLLDRLAVLASFEAIGTATAAMEMTVAYAKDRVAFGQRIGRYQGVKHKLADMYIKLELARAHALHAVASIEGADGELTQAAAAARVSSLDALRFAAEEAVQLHGGIGFTWEHDCQFYYRRSRQLAAQYGTRPFWSERLVRALERRNRTAA